MIRTTRGGRAKYRSTGPESLRVVSWADRRPTALRAPESVATRTGPLSWFRYRSPAPEWRSTGPLSRSTSRLPAPPSAVSAICGGTRMVRSASAPKRSARPLGGQISTPTHLTAIFRVPPSRLTRTVGRRVVQWSCSLTVTWPTGPGRTLTLPASVSTTSALKSWR
ncbi:hypothetical protein GXW82_24985 [Streptacidiphilus sp. 4-A2]|nr:hypothetical protein [Streptacidiphilus sp. 4-A2]